ncbi:MATE family efflux transporter [Rhodobacteraceae bacterium RKSG542]|uniref:MATE family efflux transporter n=1 Tax=Pseudovibrio flavus TaxID=2529854 RepID=UPI0012BCC0C3|nr:MATE family efflux transporter [Pseudovibrio flavus]MTI16198.1 MATE family efflux transporter [Pseudovibrio flavus]
MTNTRFSFARFLSEIGALLTLSLPIIITQIATQSMAFVDTSMAGQASAVDLAAIAVGASLWVPVSLLMRGTIMALTPITSHHVGAGRLDQIAHDLGQTLWIALMCSVLLVAYIIASQPLLTYMEVAPEIVPIASDYMTALAFGVPGIAIFYCLISFCEGMGNTRAPMIVALMGLVANIPLNYILIYGKFGFPQLGAVGCGWATSFVYWLMASTLLGYIVHHKEYRGILNLREMMPSFARIWDILKLGVPIGVNIFICGSIFALIALLIGKLGANNIAAHQVALNFSAMVYMVPMSLAFGITIRVGHILGQGDKDAARLRSLSGLLLTVAFSSISASCILLFPEAIIGIYTNNADVIASASVLLVFAAVYQISDAVQTSANGALRGYKDTRVPMVIAFVSYWVVALPLGYILGLTNLLVPAMGASGFWVGIVVGLTLAAILMLLRLAVVFKRNRTAGEEEPQAEPALLDTVVPEPA